AYPIRQSNRRRVLFLADRLPNLRLLQRRRPRRTLRQAYVSLNAHPRRVDRVWGEAEYLLLAAGGRSLVVVGQKRRASATTGEATKAGNDRRGDPGLARRLSQACPQVCPELGNSDPL